MDLTDTDDNRRVSAEIMSREEKIRRKEMYTHETDETRTRREEVRAA